MVLAASTVVFVGMHRSLAQLLPLAAMLELSVTFPGPAPSRYVVARDAGDPTKLQEIVARAQRGDPMVNLVDADAARDILGLVAALGSHDLQTRGHSERVRVYTDLISEQMRLPPEERGHLRWAALLHDVGKLKVPAAVESKGPHVMEKLGMMAEALAEGLDDEEAFMEHMRGGVWKQAQAVLAGGKF
jgi:HD-GYP domain-containing protein (c-di-GMP phosphodiesterase class II)